MPSPNCKWKCRFCMGTVLVETNLPARNSRVNVYMAKQGFGHRCSYLWVPCPKRLSCNGPYEYAPTLKMDAPVVRTSEMLYSVSKLIRLALKITRSLNNFLPLFSVPPNGATRVLGSSTAVANKPLLGNGYICDCLCIAHRTIFNVFASFTLSCTDFFQSILFQLIDRSLLISRLIYFIVCLYFQLHLFIGVELIVYFIIIFLIIMIMIVLHTKPNIHLYIIMNFQFICNIFHLLMKILAFCIECRA